MAKEIDKSSSFQCHTMLHLLIVVLALFAKSPYALPLLLRKGIRDEWTAQKETVTNNIKEELLGAEVKLFADVDGIWKTMVDAKNVSSSFLSRLPISNEWLQSKQDVDLVSIAPNFGSYLYQYFNGFLYQIQYQFKKDDLMVEGFTDAVPTGEIWVEVVPKDKLKDAYNECKVEDGKIILRTTPLNWGANASYVAEKLSNLL